MDKIAEKNNLSEPSPGSGTGPAGPIGGVARKAGDLIERVGEKVEQAGDPKTGQAIAQAGDQIEHLDASDWMAQFNQRATEFERRVESVIRKRPLMVLAG